MSVQEIRQQQEADDIDEIDWAGLPESGSNLNVSVTYGIRSGDILTQEPTVPFREISKIERLKRKIQSEYDEGLVAVNRDTEEVIVSARDSHRFAEEMAEIDLDPDKILIIRVDE